MPIGNTSYRDGTVNTQVSGGQTYGGTITTPGQEPLLTTDDMRRLLQQRALEVRQQGAQANRMRDQGRAAMGRSQQQAVGRYQQQPQGPSRMNQGMEPTYVKMIEGPGRIPGYIQVPPGTPGAVVSGMTQRGQGMRIPSAGHISGVGAQEDVFRQEAADADFARFSKSSGAAPRGR